MSANAVLAGAMLGGALVGFVSGLIFVLWLVYETVYGSKRLAERIDETDSEYRRRMLSRLRWPVVVLTPFGFAIIGAFVGASFAGVIVGAKWYAVEVFGL